MNEEFNPTKEWLESQAWRAQAKDEELIFFVIQLHAALKDRDDEALHHWVSDVINHCKIRDMTEEQIQGVVDRHFANLIANVGEPNES